MKMKLDPLADKVIVRPRVTPKKDKTLFTARTLESAVASAYVEEYHGEVGEQIGTVIAIGKKATKTGVSVGDTVLFSGQSGRELVFDDEDATRLIVMLEEDLLAVIGQGTSIEAEELIV